MAKKTESSPEGTRAQTAAKRRMRLQLCLSQPDRQRERDNREVFG